MNPVEKARKITEYHLHKSLRENDKMFEPIENAIAKALTEFYEQGKKEGLKEAISLVHINFNTASPVPTVEAIERIHRGE